MRAAKANTVERPCRVCGEIMTLSPQQLCKQFCNICRIERARVYDNARKKAKRSTEEGKAKQRIKHKQWYEKNREARRQQIREYKKGIKSKLYSFLGCQSLEDCEFKSGMLDREFLSLSLSLGDVIRERNFSDM
jgi:hypothetical protein